MTRSETHFALVLDVDEKTRILLGDALTSRGYTARLAESTATAQQLMAAAEFRVLVLGPGLTPRAVRQALRMCGSLAMAPKLIVVGAATEGEVPAPTGSELRVTSAPTAAAVVDAIRIYVESCD